MLIPHNNMNPNHYQFQAIFVDKEKGFAAARSNIRNTDRRMSFEINTLIADPSFDVWSLGCVLYQLCTPGMHILRYRIAIGR